MASQIDNTNASFPGTVTAGALVLSTPGRIAGRLEGVTPTAVSYAAQDTDDVILVTATGQTITLPTAVGREGKAFTIKLTAAGSCTVATTASQNIDAATTYSLAAQYNSVTVISDGTQWYILAKI